MGHHITIGRIDGFGNIHVGAASSSAPSGDARARAAAVAYVEFLQRDYNIAYRENVDSWVAASKAPGTIILTLRRDASPEGVLELVNAAYEFARRQPSVRVREFNGDPRYSGSTPSKLYVTFGA